MPRPLSKEDTELYCLLELASRLQTHISQMETSREISIQIESNEILISSSPSVAEEMQRLHQQSQLSNLHQPLPASHTTIQYPPLPGPIPLSEPWPAFDDRWEKWHNPPKREKNPNPLPEKDSLNAHWKDCEPL